MYYDIDIRKEETSVETVLRRVKQSLKRQQLKSSAPYANDSTEFIFNDIQDYENIKLDPELYFLIDYAGRSYDPRTVPGNTRFYKLKSMIMRVMRLYTTRQVEFNATLVRVLNRFFDVFNNISNVFDYFRQAEVNIVKRLEHAEEIVGKSFERLDNHRARFEYAEHTIGKSLERLDNHRDRLEEIEATNRILDKRLAQVEDLKNKLELALAENAALRKRLDKLISSPVTLTQPTEKNIAIDIGEKSAALIAQEVTNDHLYFPYLNEDRGIEQVIKSRMKSYIDFFTVLNKKNPNNFVLDVGCGRGEFLDLCAKSGIPAKGIDINEDMVNHCKNKKLDVKLADAIEYLINLDDNSLSGIIGCQIIEHLPTYDLLKFVRLCYAKLASGGKLVFETPNPSSFFALSMFYRDFTHEKPVHPHTLEFLLSETGFKKVKIEESNPSPINLNINDNLQPEIKNNFKKLNNTIYGNLDYAVFAVK